MIKITDLCDVLSSPPIRRRIGAQPRRCVALKQQQVKGVGTLEEAKKFFRNQESSLISMELLHWIINYQCRSEAGAEGSVAPSLKI
jgi:hypothetical protein